MKIYGHGSVTFWLNYLDESFIICAMKDLIEERDRKAKMQHSIVKWWNVHYMTPEELTEEQIIDETRDASQTEEGADERMQSSQQDDSAAPDEYNSSQEILRRLEREAAEDEEIKRQEIEQARREAEANLNTQTGAYSGAYGAQGADGEHKEQIDAILAEKEEALRDLIEQNTEK